MTNVEDIARAVERLDDADLARFRDWFARLEADRYDQAIEADIEAGRLDKVLEEALAEVKAGRTTPL